MKIIFLRKKIFQQSQKGRISFWNPTKVRYDFEIVTRNKENKMMDIFEKELKLNWLSQLKPEIEE